MYEPDIFATTQAVRDDPRERRHRPADPRARPRLGAVHREHPRRLPAPLHRQRGPDGDRPGAAQRRVPDRRRVRRPAADLAADPRAGRVPLHQRLHRQAGRHRDRRQGADARRSRPGFGAPFLPRHPGEYAAHARRPPRAVRRPGLAREHRLDRRPVRHRRADEHRPHPEHGPGGDQRRARGRRRRSRTRSSGSRSRSASRACPTRSSVPRATWADPIAYDAAARRLATCSTRTSRGYADGVSDAIRDAGPIAVHEDHGDIAVSAPGEG